MKSKTTSGPSSQENSFPSDFTANIWEDFFFIFKNYILKAFNLRQFDLFPTFATNWHSLSLKTVWHVFYGRARKDYSSVLRDMIFA